MWIKTILRMRMERGLQAEPICKHGKHCTSPTKQSENTAFSWPAEGHSPNCPRACEAEWRPVGSDIDHERNSRKPPTPKLLTNTTAAFIIVGPREKMMFTISHASRASELAAHGRNRGKITSINVLAPRENQPPGENQNSREEDQTPRVDHTPSRSRPRGWTRPRGKTRPRRPNHTGGPDPRGRPDHKGKPKHGSRPHGETRRLHGRTRPHERTRQYGRLHGSTTTREDQTPPPREDQTARADQTLREEEVPRGPSRFCCCTACGRPPSGLPWSRRRIRTHGCPGTPLPTRKAKDRLARRPTAKL